MPQEDLEQPNKYDFFKKEKEEWTEDPAWGEQADMWSHLEQPKVGHTAGFHRDGDPYIIQKHMIMFSLLCLRRQVDMIHEKLNEKPTYIWS